MSTETKSPYAPAEEVPFSKMEAPPGSAMAVFFNVLAVINCMVLILGLVVCSVGYENRALGINLIIIGFASGVSCIAFSTFFSMLHQIVFWTRKTYENQKDKPKAS